MAYTITAAATTLPNIKEVLPQLIASGDEDIFVGDCWIDQIILTPLSTASNVSITIKDKQGTPVPVLSVAVSAGEALMFKNIDAFMKGGLTVNASVANQVALRIRFRH